MANKEIIAQKEEMVKALAEELKESQLVLVVDYRGTSVADDTKLRKDLRETNGNCKVVKNNILRRALKANGEEGLDEILVGPNAVVLAEENYLNPLKVIYKFTKSHDNYKIKGGLIEGKLMPLEDILTLAQLPSREELLSKLAGSLLQTIAKLAVAVDQVRIKKEEEGDSPAEEPAKEEAEAKVEETAEEKVEAKVEETAEEKAEAKAEKTAETKAEEKVEKK